jgi:hypothetical protein
MKKEEKSDRHDIRWGKELSRLKRLTARSGMSAGEIARQALIDYELSRSEYRDTVRDAVLALFQSLVPDEQYDPVEDPRQQEALQALGDVLHSGFAAEGIAEAFTSLLAENTLAMSTLRVPSVGNQEEESDG